MAQTLSPQQVYYILLGIYGILLLFSLGYYFTRKAPGGDASVGWAIGILYTAALAGIVAVAWMLRSYPAVGLPVLSLPLLFFVWPYIRRARRNFYIRYPAYKNTPLLTLYLQNNTTSKLHIQLDCWFPTSNKNSAVLYTTFDYYLEPLEKSVYPLNALQTRLLAHKSKYVSVTTFEQVVEKYEDCTYIKDIQPCMQFYEESIEAFRSGEYAVTVDAK